MKPIFKQILFLCLILLALGGHAAADSLKVGPQKLRVAPLKYVRNDVTEGTGAKDVVSSESASNPLDEGKGGSKVSVTTVALFTLAMAAASGFGAVPFFFVELDPQWAGLCNGMAAGVMLAASFDLIQEGQDHGHGSWVVIGILAGGIFISLCKKVMIFYLLATFHIFLWYSLLEIFRSVIILMTVALHFDLTQLMGCVSSSFVAFAVEKKRMIRNFGPRIFL